MALPDFEDTLKSLGLALPPIPIPQGAYIPAVRSGNWVFVSGQLPILNGELLFEGRVGDTLSLEQGQEAAKLCFLNVVSAALSTGVKPQAILRLVKLTGYVQCAQDFFQQPRVMNAASELAHILFGPAGIHARAAVGVNALPRNAPVEIEAIFEVQ